MNSSSDKQWTPPAPCPPIADLPVWRLLWELRTSNISIWPERAYDELLLPRRVFGLDTLLVNDPAGIKDVLATRAADYRRYMVTPRLLRPVAGDGVLLAEGDDWRQQRRSVSPAFTPANVDRVLPQFGQSADHLCTRIADQSRSGGVNLYRLFQTATIDALGRGLFSFPLGHRAEILAKMARAYFAGPGRPNAADSFARHEGQFRWATWRRRKFEKAWFAQIDAILSDWRRASPASNGTGSRAEDIMTVMSRWRDPSTGSPLSERELRHQTATMIAAGFETTALTMFWTAFLLANNPDTQEAIRKEVNAPSPADLKSAKDLERWPRLREAIWEAMRLYPPVAFMSRIAVEPTVLCGREVAPGTIIVISPWVLHRHRKFWSDPELFRPERFGDNPRAHIAGGAFIPFGSGPRSCVGATFAFSEAMILLASLVGRFDIRLASSQPLVPRAIISTMPSREPAFEVREIRS